MKQDHATRREAGVDKVVIGPGCCFGGQKWTLFRCHGLQRHPAAYSFRQGNEQPELWGKPAKDMRTVGNFQSSFDQGSVQPIDSEGTPLLLCGMNS